VRTEDVMGVDLEVALPSWAARVRDGAQNTQKLLLSSTNLSDCPSTKTPSSQLDKGAKQPSVNQS
jgi:hypothetical protein